MHPANEAQDSQLTDALYTLVSALPKPVQEFVLGDERPRIVLSLSEKYDLHVDQAGVFEQALTHMLLGASSPQEFVDVLTKAGLSSETVRSLAQEVNERVFVPLRKAEQAAPVPSASTAISTPPILPGSSEPVPLPRIQTPVPPAPTIQTPPMMAPFPYAQPMYYSPQPVPQAGYTNPFPAPMYAPPIYMWPQQQQSWATPQQTASAPNIPAAPPAAPPVVSPVAQTPQVATPPPKKTTLNSGGSLDKNYVADPYREPFAG